MEISFCSHLSYSKVIFAMKFCTWHDSCAVVECAKFCSDMMLYDGVTLKRISRRIWWKKIVREMCPNTVGYRYCICGQDANETKMSSFYLNTTSGASSDKNFAKMTFPFQWFGSCTQTELTLERSNFEKIQINHFSVLPLKPADFVTCVHDRI